MTLERAKIYMMQHFQVPNGKIDFFAEACTKNLNTNRAEGRGANARLFHLTSLSNFSVTRVILLHEV